MENPLRPSDSGDVWSAWVVDCLRPMTKEEEAAYYAEHRAPEQQPTEPAYTEYRVVCLCGHSEIHGDPMSRRECRVCSDIKEER